LSNSSSSELQQSFLLWCVIPIKIHWKSSIVVISGVALVVNHFRSLLPVAPLLPLQGPLISTFLL
jgi:hypothetical protein